MKSKIIIFLCSALCLIIIFAALNRAEQLPSGNSTAIVEPMGDKTLQSIYSECPVVLIGTVKDISSVDGIGESVITLDVLEIIKGEAEAEIQQYDIPKEVNMEMGKTYMVFLDKSYITVYPRPLYTAWLKEAVLKVENGKLKVNVMGSDWYLRQLPEDTDEAVEYLKSLPVTYSDTEEYSIPENFELTEENIKNCDYVFTMKPTEVYAVHGEADEVIFNITANYKGSMTKFKKIMPARVGFENGKEYLVFMVEGAQESIQLAAYNGAVICEDDDNYGEALELVKSLFGEQN